MNEHGKSKFVTKADRLSTIRNNKLIAKVRNSKHQPSCEFLYGIQLFRERLSYKRRKAYATMSKVILGNGGFYGCLSEPQGVLAWWN